MICVAEIKLIEVNRDFVYISRFENMPPITQVINSNDPFEKMEVTEEMVRGKRFINAVGKEFCIGMTEDVQKAIGLPFEAFDNMMDVMNRCRRETESMKKQISDFRKLGYWKRLLIAARNEL